MTICSWKHLSNCLHLLSKHSWDIIKLQFRELVVRRGSSGNLWIRRHRAARAGAPDGSKAIAEAGGGRCCLKEGNNLDLQGWNGAAPALGLAPPRQRGTRRYRLRSTVCKRKKGKERSLVLHLGGGWPELQTTAIPTRGALRLPAAANWSATNPNHIKKL
jgi:hypothetical protein